MDRIQDLVSPLVEPREGPGHDVGCLADDVEPRHTGRCQEVRYLIARVDGPIRMKPIVFRFTQEDVDVRRRGAAWRAYECGAAALDSRAWTAGRMSPAKIGVLRG